MGGQGLVQEELAELQELEELEEAEVAGELDELAKLAQLDACPGGTGNSEFEYRIPRSKGERVDLCGLDAGDGRFGGFRRR